jgi:GNAT superfamily N-acetyltransferase
MAVEIRRAALSDARMAYSIVSEYYEAARVLLRDDPASFSQQYFEPGTGIWLALHDGQPVGSIALRKLLPGAAEIKRMYVRPEWRGQGISLRLLRAAEGFARETGYRWIYLDTSDEMTAARRLYERQGYRPCPRYNQNPQATIFMRKRLAP